LKRAHLQEVNEGQELRKTASQSVKAENWELSNEKKMARHIRRVWALATQN